MSTIKRNGMLTDEEYDIEEGRIAAAESAGRNVALFELRSGHTVPRDWSRDGDPYAGAYSHLAAVGFTRLGCRMYVLPFINAYRAEFPAGSEGPPAFKVVKNGHDWDYSTHRIDAERWRDKILREEPDARVEIRETTRARMMEWKEGL